MTGPENHREGAWPAVAAALPTALRAERERPFWRAIAASLAWRWVVDAGCGSGFHLALLRELGVSAVGFDRALDVLANAGVGATAAGDLCSPPMRRGAFDAAICLGNTVSLLPDRPAQRRALAALAGLVRTGGTVLVQGEDAAALAAGGPLLRVRRTESGDVHVRVFERVGRRVRMLAGVVREGAETHVGAAWLLPTSPATLARAVRGLPLAPARLPAEAPAGAGWWAAFSVRSTAP